MSKFESELLIIDIIGKLVPELPIDNTYNLKLCNRIVKVATCIYIVKLTLVDCI